MCCQENESPEQREMMASLGKAWTLIQVAIFFIFVVVILIGEYHNPADTSDTRITEKPVWAIPPEQQEGGLRVWVMPAEQQEGGLRERYTF